MARPPKDKDLARNPPDRLLAHGFGIRACNRESKRSRSLRFCFYKYLLLEGNVTIRYEIVADIPELQKLTADLGKIGSNLNQIAKYFNMGGIRSISMQDEIHECISKIFEMREDVRKMAGDYHGSIETHR